jgi:1,4-dihydroxy-2-naphthoate octaprenyltransferase
MISTSAIFKASRYNDWWGCKMSPLLAVGYGTAILSDKAVYQVAGGMVLILVGLVVGGIYASTINDINDLHDDSLCGKENRISKIPRKYRWLFSFGSLAAGVALALFLWQSDPLTSILYAMPCLCFTLYSFEPFRLKRRGLWGVLADAAGAHLFPVLCMIAAVSMYGKVAINWPWFILGGTWSFGFGLRGILWHQFQDRERDIQAGIHTYATRLSPTGFRVIPKVIIGIEMLAFSGMMVLLKAYVTIPLFLIYLWILYYNADRFGIKPGIIVTPAGRANQIFLLDYYIFFFPLALLIQIIGEPYGPLILIMHLIIFPLTPIRTLKTTYYIVKRIK